MKCPRKLCRAPMKAVDAGGFVCTDTDCGAAVNTWELTGQMDYSVYRPGAVFTQPTADEIAAEEEHIRSCTHEKQVSAAQANKPNHPGRLPADDPRNIAWRAKQRAAHLGKPRGVRA